MPAVYNDIRPSLTVEISGDKRLGNYYYAAFYRITSRNRLTATQIHALRSAGFLGYGQEFYILSQCDDKVAPAGHDEVPCIDSVTGKPAIEPRTGKAYGPAVMPFYVYECEARVDSSD